MRLRHACVRRQVACESEGLRAYAELQRKHRAAYGDNEEAREAAGKAALLRAKALLSSAWVARLRCEERGRLAAAGRLVAAPVRRFRGVRQQVHRVRKNVYHRILSFWQRKSSLLENNPAFSFAKVVY